MNTTRRALFLALLFAAATVLPIATATPPHSDAPPNWKGGGTGTTTPVGGVDVDEVTGKSTHLGRFSGLGFHVTDPMTFTYVGEATWTASNGDTLNVTYTGQIFLSGDPDFPFGIIGTLIADGGTGRLANAQGEAVMTGGFSGVPGNLYFNFIGTMNVSGN